MNYLLIIRFEYFRRPGSSDNSWVNVGKISYIMLVFPLNLDSQVTHLITYHRYLWEISTKYEVIILILRLPADSSLMAKSYPSLLTKNKILSR